MGSTIFTPDASLSGKVIWGELSIFKGENYSVLVSLPHQKVKFDKDGNFLKEDDKCPHAGNASFHLPNIYWVSTKCCRS